MVNDNNLSNLILNELANKVRINKNREEYLDIFNQFKKVVAQEVRHITAIFPEYTPHDEEFHLKRLFDIAERILGEKLILSLNSTELLLLSLALYGHDWGMAVSLDEKFTIVNDIYDYSKHSLLKDEKELFTSHLVDYNETNKNVSDFCWQEYVRKTHAIRSAQRVRNYFENIDKGIGEALARACEGHWLNVDSLKDKFIFPTSYSVLGEVVNLRAISIYVRLIDLFDITNERTPYVIYKYTAPKNLRSKMEWEKHRAINSLNPINSQNGRIIRVDGQTSCHEVYAELLDLKAYCLEQLRACIELLDDMNLSAYNLEIYDILWNIIPQGFDPITINFQFDRNRMFEILSDEIYQGDKHVFLREVIQNSIDAIKLRHQFLAKKTGYDFLSNGHISVDVENHDDGDMVIKIFDDGIGMDKYIVENYLSVAGKSYYRSEEFKKLGLTMDPISKFGVGILSCFMVADRIQIKTFRDPYIKTDSKVLKIDIPFVDKQFRIEENNPTQFDSPGTLLTIYVSSEKLKDEAGIINKLYVTEYLKSIAGMVEFPIVIKEDGIETVIVNPLLKDQSYLNRFSGKTIFSNPTNVSFEEIFYPQNLKVAKENFTFHTISINEDLGIDNVVGFVNYIVPKDINTKIQNIGRSWPADDIIIRNSKKRQQEKRLQFKSGWTRYSHRDIPDDWKIGRSAYSQPTYRVYLDGILISEAESPKDIDRGLNFKETRFSYIEDRFSVPFVIINLTKIKSGNTDISRRNLIKGNIHWEDCFKVELFDFILNSWKSKLLEAENKERMFLISQLEMFYRVPFYETSKFLDIKNCPVQIISKNGEINYQKWGELINDIIYLQPRFTPWFKELSSKSFNDELDLLKNDRKFLWIRDPFVVCGDDSEYSNNDEKSTMQDNNACNYYKYYLSITHQRLKFRFIPSPYAEGPPLIQEVCEPKKSHKEENEESIIKSFSEGNFELDHIQLNSLIMAIDKFHFGFPIPEIGFFDKPYENYFAYGISHLNYHHQNTKNLLQILCSLHLVDENDQELELLWGLIGDKLGELIFIESSSNRYSPFEMEEINLIFKEIDDYIVENALIKKYNPFLKITEDSFVDESIFLSKDDLWYVYLDNVNLDLVDLNEEYFEE